jgi:hypothetical protein
MRSLSLHDEIELLPTSTVVIAHYEPKTAEELAHHLRPHSARVIVAENVSNLRPLILHHEARVAVLDLDLVKVEEVRQLARTFRNLTIVCTHPAPDDRMWVPRWTPGQLNSVIWMIFAHCCGHRWQLRFPNFKSRLNYKIISISSTGNSIRRSRNQYGH